MKAKNFWMIVLLAVFAATFFCVCGSVGPTGPEPPPPPPPEKTYTLQVQYTRTYVNPNTVLNDPLLLLFDLSGNRLGISLYRTDNYHFNGELGGVKIRADYYFHCYDGGRYDGSDLSSTMVGDIFIVTVKETQFIKELKDIRPYTLPTNLYPGPLAKAVFFQLTSDGKIISDQ